MEPVTDLHAEYAKLARDADVIAAWLARIEARGGLTLRGELAALDAFMDAYSVRRGELSRLQPVGKAN